MKFIPSTYVALDSIIGTKLHLSVTLILLEEAAQIIICDQRNALSNMVCTMNIYQDVRLSNILVVQNYL